MRLNFKKSNPILFFYFLIWKFKLQLYVHTSTTPKSRHPQPNSHLTAWTWKTPKSLWILSFQHRHPREQNPWVAMLITNCKCGEFTISIRTLDRKATLIVLVQRHYFMGLKESWHPIFHFPTFPPISTWFSYCLSVDMIFTGGRGEEFPFLWKIWDSLFVIWALTDGHEKTHHGKFQQQPQFPWADPLIKKNEFGVLHWGEYFVCFC